jgi:hypothetical protein
MKKTLFTALFTLSALLPLGVNATGTLEEHQVLMDTLKSHGVKVVINDSRHCETGTHGVYISQSKTLIVCQDHAHSLKITAQVRWTQNDLDTLRHEAHHMLQDCADGALGDGNIIPVIRDPATYQQFVSNGLTDEQITGITEHYVKNGATPDVVKRELEAFSSAATIGPTQLAGFIDRLCTIK